MRLAFALLALLAVSVASGCDTSDGSSLYDPEAPDGPAPVIDAVSPSGVVLAGVDVISITGQNFSAVATDNIVFFDDAQGTTARGTVVEASATQLRVQTPNLPSPALRVRVSVVGAEAFSNSVALPLTAAVARVSDFGRAEEAFGATTDAAGNLYISLTAEGASSGVQRIAPDGTRSVYYDATSAIWSDLAIAPDGTLYGVRGLRAVFRLPQGGDQEVLAALPNGVVLSAIDVDASGAVWVGGNNAAIYRITPDGTTSSFAFGGNVRAISVAGETLYAAVTQDGVSRIVRASIAGGTLGALEEVANVTAFNGRRATSLAVAASGDLYVGTVDDDVTRADPDPILYVPAGGAPEVLYPGVLSGPVTSLSFGGTGLYLAKTPSPGTSVTPPTPADLVRVEVRQPGAP